MADWPDLDALKAELGVTTDARDETLSNALAASIEQVKLDTAGEIRPWSDTGDPSADPPVPADTVTSSLSSAALILAVMVSKAPAAPYGIVAAFDLGAVRVASTHPTYRKLLKGSRRAFGIA